MLYIMYVFGYSFYVILLNYMVLIIGFGLGMVDFDVNFLELSDVDVLVEFDMKQVVNVFVSICFVVLLLEMDVKKIDRFIRKC